MVNEPAQPTRLRAVGLIAAAALTLITAVPAGAQDEGPVVVGVEKEWQTIKLEPLHFTLDLVGRHDTSRVVNHNGPTTNDTENILIQTVTTSTTGFIGHPNLVSLNLSGTVGLEEQFIDDESTGRHEDPFQSITEYDVSAQFLRQSDLPTTLYSFRTQTLIDRQFGNSLDSMVMQSGLRAILRSGAAPCNFEYFHREENQSDDLDISNFNLTQDTVESQGQYQPDPGQLLSWDYELDNVQQSGNVQNTNSYVQSNLLATYSLDFGPQQEHNSRSTLLVYNETGNFPLDHVRLDEALRLNHTPRFETLYNYTLDWQHRPDLDQLLNGGDIGFRHELFDSLVTTAQIGGSILQVTPADFTSTQVFGNLEFDYHKKVPYGELLAALFLRVDWQDDSEQGSSILITDELHVFGPAGLIVLDRRNVDPASIHMTDANGFFVYTEGIDYTVSVLGNRVEIRRVLGGSIGNTQLVQVDYSIGPEPGNTTTSIGTGGTLRYDIEEGILNGVGMYVRYFHQDQHLHVVEGEVMLPANVDDLILGVDYHLGYVTLSAEQETYDSTLSPYNATRLDARYDQPLGFGSSLGFNASYDDIDQTDDDNRATVIAIGSRWTQQLTNRLSINLGALWRSETGTATSDVQGWEQVVEFNWRYRQTSVYGSFRNSILNNDRNDSSFQTVTLGVRREF